MNHNNEESRESLDLLASAAEQSSPQSRIKRNTACVACRDSKVKCNATLPGQPCQRCGKLGFSCVVDKSHKRVSKRSKFEELVQEVQNIKQAVGPRASSEQLPLPPLPPQQQHPHISQAADGSRIYPGAPFVTTATPISSIASFSTPVPPRIQEPSQVTSDLTPGHIATPASAGPRGQSQPRALKSRVFAGQDIDLYFDEYFKNFHPYLPIIRMRDPDTIYNAGPVLFWVIMATSCRRAPHGSGVFDFLVDSVKSEVWESVSDPPLSLATINALLILSAWPLPTIRFMKDPSPIYASMLMNSCYLLGIHTGRGDFPAVTYPTYRLSVSDEEAVYTWVGYNIISQRISTYTGTPSTGQLFNKTIEGIIDRTSPVQVPLYLYVLLESASFLHRLSRMMAATLEEGRGVSHYVIDHLVEDFSKIQRLVSADGISDVDQFTILSTLLEVQIYYFVPTPDFSPEIFKRNALRCYTTAQGLVRLAHKLSGELDFLSFAPHFVCRSMLTAACIIISALVSPTLKDFVEAYLHTEGSTPDAVVADALSAVRACSVQDGDLPVRAAKMMESAFSVRNLLPPTEMSQLGTPEYSHRLGMGLPLDCIRRWKRQMEQMRQGVQLPGAVGGAGASGAGAGGTMGAADPAAMMDWDEFMKDFDWNFDPALIDTVPMVPQAAAGIV